MNEPTSPAKAAEDSMEDDAVTLETVSLLDAAELQVQLRALQTEIERLRQQLSISEAELSNTREINNELASTKHLLSEEIVELTKALFEEANGMVANEAKARFQLEGQRRKLQIELDFTRERLKLESMQLAELRSRLYAVSAEDGGQSLLKNTIAKVSLELPQQINFTNHYFEDFFPERRFDSRSKRNCRANAAWESIFQNINEGSFDEFAKFVEKCTGLLNDDEAFLGHQFMKRCFEMDVLPCLISFDCKPKAFLKRIVKSMLRNTCYIERIPPVTRPPSRCETPISAGVPPRSNTPASTLDGAVRVDSPLSADGGRSKFKGLASQFAWSVTSLPEMNNDPGAVYLDGQNSRASPVKSSKNPLCDLPAPFCALCGARNDGTTLIYRFKLVDQDPYMQIDASCRERLAAAGDFYTFMRHLRRGLFHQRPIIDLYFELFHYKRNMFYARTGSMPFFAQSDFEVFAKRAVARSNNPESPLDLLETLESVALGQ